MLDQKLITWGCRFGIFTQTLKNDQATQAFYDYFLK